MKMTNEKNKQDNLFGETIYKYGIEEATDDGMLVAMENLHAGWKDGPISHITNGVFGKYSNEDVIDMPSIMDLLSQSIRKVNNQIKKNGPDSFWEVKIKDRDAQTLRLFVQVNELKKLTIMLPSEY